MDGLQLDDISTAKHLKDLIICKTPLPQLSSRLTSSKAQMQCIFGPEYAHDMKEITDQPMDNIYTKFDVVPIKVDNVWHARGIVYLRSEQGSEMDINQHLRYKVLACGKSEVDILGALQGL